MPASDLLGLLASALAVALFAGAAVAKLRAHKAVAAWVGGLGWRWPAAAPGALAAIDLLFAGGVLAQAGAVLAHLLAISAVIAFSAFRMIATRAGIGDCPCLGSATGDSVVATRLLWLVGAINALAAFVAFAAPPAPAPMLPAIGVALAALCFGASSGLVASGYRRHEESRGRERSVSDHAAARELAALAGASSGPVALFFGSTRCDGCLRAGKLYAALARDLAWPCLIDMDVDVAAPARLGGARLVRVDAVLKRQLALHARPTLVVSSSEGLRSFIGLDRCLIGISQLPSLGPAIPST